MRREGTVVQACRYPDPTEPIGMQDEWLVSRERIIAFGAGFWLVIGRFGGDKIGNIQASPPSRVRIPPDQLLSLAPRRFKPSGRAEARL